MASFNNTIITSKGHALIAKIVAGTANPSFTKIRTSDHQYESGTDFEALTSMISVKQTVDVANVTKVSPAKVKVSGVFTNASLETGYYVRNIGLYAIDPEEGEILYSITTAIEPDWIPPQGGAAVSSILIDIETVVSNADNVDMTVDPNATATVQMVNDLASEIADVKAFVGYTEDDVYGVEVDFTTNVFKRLAWAIYKTPGDDFNEIEAFGGRKRCNLADDGTVNAYYGDTGYIEDGSNGQVMVEQPKFYYKVVPLQLDEITDGIGYHLRKARYYVSDKPKAGFEVHPAFVRNGVEKDKIYLPAYEACIQRENGTYILDDEQSTNFSVDKLASIAFAKPASGLTQQLTRANTRTLAANRGSGWQQKDVLCASASQMLMTIEYAAMNMQDAIGLGVVDKDSGEGNESELTGATSDLGNASGMATGTNGLVSITYRGEENFWGNIQSWIDGLNVHIDSETYETDAYWADHSFADNTDASPYEHVGFSLAPDTTAYISAFGYSENCDFLFLPSETLGNSSLPVGDRFYNASDGGWRGARLGGSWSSGLTAGAFHCSVSGFVSFPSRSYGGGVVYVPQDS